eukprot:NODE_1041_length_1146_cov_216.863263_g793_i0.p1 GENE.NODE_1041_length_1146_cov_216.863263_g793_i0~~NODE_1041_length_1146_cov_216.863263_g793_i0.p1  ORF type:complete len:353 (-),score=49.05 NODE_1041_length_1146_cov_216.863263_g793_i0:87-1091(-)
MCHDECVQCFLIYFIFCLFLQHFCISAKTVTHGALHSPSALLLRWRAGNRTTTLRDRGQLPPAHPLSIIQKLPAPSGLDIAVITAGPESMLRRYAFQLSSKPCYATRQQYSFILDSMTRLPSTEHLIPKAWTKVVVLRKWLPFFDCLFWVDMDATLFQPNFPLEPFILQRPSAHLVVPQDWPGKLVFSNDAFIIRNSDWSRKFLALWWAGRLPCRDTHADQGAMWRAIAATLLPPFSSDLFPCDQFCPSKIDRLRLYSCFESVFASFVHDPALTFTTANFTAGESGLCLNGHQFQHASFPAMHKVLPFCLHSKHPTKWNVHLVRKKLKNGMFRC